jgi:quinol-cytochrome oxidoreductase complex cytochrome b subunit
MFSTGQLLFALFFIVGFIILTVWSYRKDRAKNPVYFKGSFWVLIGFLVFIGLLLCLKRGVSL